MFEMVLSAQGGEDRFERRDDELRWWKSERIGARGRDFTEVACPGEDVLKDVAMDSSEMGNIELASNRSQDKLRGSNGGKVSSKLRQLRGID